MRYRNTEVCICFITWVACALCSKLDNAGSKELTIERFFDSEENNPFFNVKTTKEPTFNDLAQKMFGRSTEEKFFETEETFFDNENNLFKKMDNEETFFDKSFFVKEETESPVTEHNQMCACQTLHCQCCYTFRVLKLKQFRVCVSMEYVQNDFCILSTLTVNSHTIVTKILSGRNPLPYCARTVIVPLLQLCVRLYDIHHNSNGMSMCVRLEVQSLLKQILCAISFDCIKIEDKKMSFMLPPPVLTFGLVNIHVGANDPYISYRDWTKFHLPLPKRRKTTSTTTEKPKRHFWLLK